MEILWNQTPRSAWMRATPDAAWQQSWAYGAACMALGSRVFRAEIRDGGRPVAFAQLVHRSFLGIAHAAVCTRGPVWCDDPAPALRAEVYRRLRAEIPLPRLRGAFITPDTDTGEASVLRVARMVEVMTPYATATLDLTQDPAAMRSAQKVKWRNRLTRAEQAGVTVSRARMRPGACDWLLAEETIQRRDRRYTALPTALVPAWHAETGQDGMLMMTAHKGAERVAAMLFLVHGRGATYHIGWSSAAGRAASAHNLTLWRALPALRRMGVRCLDLGGLNTVDVPGIARFKLGSGAIPRTLCGTWF